MESPGAITRFAAMLLLAPFAPRRTARAGLNASRAAVWTLHLGGLSVLVVVGWVLAEATVRPQGPRGMRSWVWLGDGEVPVPRLVILGVVAVVCGVAAAYVVAAVFLCWAHRDESVQDTWRHALRTVRLFTPAAVLPVAVLVAANMGFVRALPLDDAQLLVLIPLHALTPLWAVWILLRALSVERWAGRPEHKPLCEECGYVLLHLPVGGRCPECGFPIAKSIGPLRRRSSKPLEHSFRSVAGLLSTSRAAWFLAPSFYRRLCLAGGRGDVAAFLVCNLALAGGVGWFVFLAGVRVIVGENVPARIWYVLAWATCGMMVSVFCGWCAIASIAGLIASRMHGRNLLHAITLVAGYTSGYYVMWAGVSAASLIAVVGPVGQTSARARFWCPVVWLALNGGLLLGCVGGVWRRVRYVRYGNWAPAEHVRAVSDATAQGTNQGAHTCAGT